MKYEIWVRKLRALRLKKGLKQSEVADLIDLSRPQYTAIENGHCVVNYKHLYNLAKAFGTTIPKLVSMDGIRARPRV